jgi:hemerythrin-like domain-containing protein
MNVGTGIAQLAGGTNMEATAVATPRTPCSEPLPDLEVPMINSLVTCLGSQHTRLSRLVAQLAFAATRSQRDPESSEAQQDALEAWNEIRRDLWSHLQIEEELVFSWADAHDAIPGTVLDTLKREHQQIRSLIAALPERFKREIGQDERPSDGVEATETLLSLATALDSHIERQDGVVLPAILRAAFRSH